LQRFAPLARYATLLLLIILFIGTHVPANSLPQSFTLIDKLVHCLAYLGLTVSVLGSWELTRGALKPQHYFTVWLAGTLYGALDEVTQIPVGRHADPSDWLSDVLGIVLGLALYRLVSPWIFKLTKFRLATSGG
jgi:VanZ family protein